MDGGSGINVLYASTLDEMDIPRSALRPSTAPFHGVIPGIEALPLGQIDLPVTFGGVRNFHIETLTSEVVGFSGTYHAILGRPAYAKFMAVPNYTYLKLKIPRPRDIITVGTTYQRAYEWDAECFQFAEAIVRSTRLHAEPHSEDQDVPDSSKRAACSFKVAKDVKDAVVSGQVSRIFRKGHVDRPVRSHGPSVKANRTTRTDPRKTDRPRRPGGPSARVPDRPLLKLGPSANQLQRKPKSKLDPTETKQEHQEHHDEHCLRGPSATTSRTVRLTRTDPETAQPRRSTPPTHHRISQTVEAVETRVWGHDKRQTRMLYPKNFAS
jgi:hypothetical protein